jgi:SAM-dependent methyltransferase
MPNDEDEQIRLSIVHQTYLFLFSNRLTTVPLDSPTRILDIGTGTGEFCIDMGEAYPDAEIIGTDISAIQPRNIPTNVYFEVDDAEDETGWTFAIEDFDLIHLRNLNGAFKDWDTIYQRSWTCLKPNGWIEVIDFDEHKKLLSCFPEESDIHRFFAEWLKASEKSGYGRDLKHLSPETLTNIGFMDVKFSHHEIPLDIWGDNEEAKSTARLWLVACLAGFEAVSMRLLTKELGWEPQEVKRICADIIEELKTIVYDPVRGKGLSVGVNVLIGRKAGVDEKSPPRPSGTENDNA